MNDRASPRVATPPGTAVPILILREGQEKALSLTPAEGL